MKTVGVLALVLILAGYPILSIILMIACSIIFLRKKEVTTEMLITESHIKFEKALHTTIDVSSLENFSKWVDYTYESSKRLQVRLHESREKGDPDDELEDFMLGKISVIAEVKWNLDRVLNSDKKDGHYD